MNVFNSLLNLTIILNLKGVFTISWNEHVIYLFDYVVSNIIIIINIPIAILYNMFHT